MDNSIEQNYRKFSILRNIALGINSPADLQEIARVALEHSLTVVNVQAGMLSVFDASGKTILQAQAGSEAKRQILVGLESELLATLRKEFGVSSAYLTLNREGVHTLFAYPLKSNGNFVGTISGITTGARNLAVEEEFLEALGNQLGIAVARKLLFPSPKRPEVIKEILDYSLNLQAIVLRLQEKMRDLAKGDLYGLVYREGTKLFDLYTKTIDKAVTEEVELTIARSMLLDQVLTRRTPLLTNRVTEIGLHTGVRGLQYLAIVPLLFDDTVIGAVYVGAVGILTQPDLEELRKLATPIACAVKNALLYRELKDAYDSLSAQQKELVQHERKEAVRQAAVTVSHEVNNPLTAVLGNTQLLLLKKQTLDPETREKLKIIEESAMRIREVTQKMLAIIEPVTKEYIEGVKMIDLDRSTGEKAQ